MQRELENLKKKILSLSALVEEAVYDSVRALNEGNRSLCQTVIEHDRDVDHQEVEVEEDCLRILSQFHPEGHDLRYVVAVLKINNDLERVGDLAANIAQRAFELQQSMQVPLIYDFSEMADLVKVMLRRSLDALIHSDTKLADLVCSQDDRLDRMHRDVFDIVDDAIQKDPVHTRIYTKYLSISRYLERIGDMATNIAEDVIYMVDGAIARHRSQG